MGDYSRDPFGRLMDAASKHYVGVRLQQGVPILDSDWNELEDLRKHEVSEFVGRFFGDGVPDQNDGFRIVPLEGAGISNLVFQVDSSNIELTRLEVILSESTAANILGFLPGYTESQRYGDSPAMLTGNATEPFALADGLTFTVRVNNGVNQTVTFASTDFSDITAATAVEVINVLNTTFIGVTVMVSDGNNFLINGGNGTLETAGRMLVQGSEVIIEDTIAYTSQLLYMNNELAQLWGVDPVSEILPVTADRQDIVYLDVWEREVDAVEDEMIVQQAIGIEATRRLKREWAVRVASGVTDLSGITRQPGHKYAALASVNRLAANNNLLGPDDLVDLRVLNLNVARYLKTPISVTRGAEHLSVNDFVDVLNAYRSVLYSRYINAIFNFAYTDPSNERFIQLIIEQLLNFTIVSAMQARTGNINNHDAIIVLTEFHRLQQEFINVITSFANADSDSDLIGDMTDFINQYNQLLNTNADSLNNQLSQNDLIGAVRAQQEINAWLSDPLNDLPEGNVQVVISNVEPTSNLAVGVPFNITYTIESAVSSPRAQEIYNISVVSVAPTSWHFLLNRTQITLDSSGGQGDVMLTVTPRAGAATSRFALTVVADRNQSGVRFTHTSPVFEIGLPPVAVEFLQWVRPTLVSGQLQLTQQNFLDNAGQIDFIVNLINTSDTTSQEYQLSHHVIPPAGEDANWFPLSTSGEQPSNINLTTPGEIRPTTSSFFFIAGGAPTIGTEGTLVVEAELLNEGGVPPSTPVITQFNIPFVVISG
ncbi:hypothetical protein SAMN05216326_13222 [Nitrosomonas marina]|uniref:Uncharacterized protein n=1 Tax=Nitrosomonas marina TaxID=917 RepID=A0A1I0F1G3_9PROT|nr:hypothetical protein [Nitrosomonas marina]SET51822.1 hypothetical protein SAMN05216326_13222 [Nitrosomonas marina]